MPINLEEEFKLCIVAMYKHIENRVAAGLISDDDAQELYHEIEHTLECGEAIDKLKADAQAIIDAINIGNPNTYYDPVYGEMRVNEVFERYRDIDYSSATDGTVYDKYRYYRDKYGRKI